MDQKATPPVNLPGTPKTPEHEEDEKKEEDKKPPIDPKRDVLILVAIFLFVVILYLLSTLLGGGGNNQTQTPPDTGTNQDQTTAPPTQSERQKALGQDEGFWSSLSSYFNGGHVPLPQNTNVLSFYHGWVRLSAGTAGNAIYPGREYITITVTKENLSYLNVATWSLEDGDGNRYYLGKATSLPIPGQSTKESPIVVGAGETLIVSSGSSPIGTSFEENTCSGYLEQFKDFFPPIAQNCTSPSWTSTWQLSNTCQNFISNLPVCETLPKNPTVNLPASCQSFIRTHFGYNTCVANHKNEASFYQGTWRVYLNQEKEIWKNPSGTITLLDNEGKIVDSLKY